MGDSPGAWDAFNCGRLPLVAGGCLVLWAAILGCGRQSRVAGGFLERPFRALCSLYSWVPVYRQMVGVGEENIRTVMLIPCLT